MDKFLTLDKEGMDCIEYDNYDDGEFTIISDDFNMGEKHIFLTREKAAELRDFLTYYLENN